MSFPEDWPEDAQTGPKFIQELIRRFPDKVHIIQPHKNIADQIEEIVKQDKQRGKTNAT